MSANDDLFLISEPPTAKDRSAKRFLFIGAAVVLAIALAGGGFLVGRSTAKSGPSTLAAAVQQASSGKLPCGTTSGQQAAFLSRMCAGSKSGSTFPRRGGYGGFGNSQNGNGQNGGAPGGVGAGAVSGTVTALSGTSLTIQTRAGQLTITLPSSVQVRTTTVANKSAITSGATVSVTTTTDSSGNRVASRIVVLPAS